MSGELTARDIIARRLAQLEGDNPDAYGHQYLTDADGLLAALDAAGLEVTEKPTEVTMGQASDFAALLQKTWGPFQQWGDAGILTTAARLLDAARGSAAELRTLVKGDTP